MASFIRVVAFLLAAIVLTACATSERLRVPDHLDINALSVNRTRGGHVLKNIIEIQSENATLDTHRTRPTPLATSRSERMSISILSPSTTIVFDTSLLDHAMQQVQQDWQRLDNKSTDNPLSINLWIIPKGESFRHRAKITLRAGDPLHLTFAISSPPGKPAIDTLANAVDTLSHELYHISRIGEPDSGALAEEVNASGWGLCSRVRFTRASGNNAVFRFHVRPDWKDTVAIEPDGLLVRLPRDIRDPVRRSQFGMAVFLQYLAALTDSDGFHTDNANHVAALFGVCEHIGSSEIRIRRD